MEKVAAGNLDLVRWIDLPSHADPRGVLTAIEGGKDLPFDIKRAYLVHHIVADRGGHAHRATEQIVIAAAGSFEMNLSNGRESRTFLLDSPTRGLFLSPMLFISMQSFAPGTCALVLASTHYDGTKSIRSWEEYLAAINPS
ncbi:sugar 3,4-ketoisomerase [Ottowia thiooxydans]|uniref:sugar 3,4-ketoisomerase n=1 Tax=Ottowia thiooxydans TaxID=219182 RepID=UPI000420DFCC|nr:FdtA/QdtA family cupin domain-containing protein [Ottowia thiooxydans]